MTADDGAAIVTRIVDAVRGAQPVREDLPGGGRIHVDRPLPFVAVHCFDGTAPQTLARRIVTSHAAYLLVPEDEWDSAVYRALFTELEDALRDAFDEVLFVEIAESPVDSLREDDSPTLADCHFKLLVPERAALADVLSTLSGALQNAPIEYNSPTTSVVESSHLADRRGAGGAGGRTHWVGLVIPPIHRVPGSDAVYPEVFSSTVAAVFDALLKAAWCFTTTRTPLRPSHHRVLGRSVFDHLVSRLDRRIEAICDAFDFLLSVTPINADAAWTCFRDSRFQRRPDFEYRPLTVNPDALKRKLYSLRVDELEDPVLASLFEEKQHEIDHQLTLLQLRNARGFRNMSAVLYGEVHADIESAARGLLEELDPEPASSGKTVGCDEFLAVAREAVDGYRREYAGFDAEVHIRDDLPPGLMVSGDCLLISRHTHTPANRVDALIQHEVGVHLLTHFTGAAQGLSILTSGLAGYEELQEGLGVFAEYAVGGLSGRRLRILAARVLACHAMLDGASFVDTFRMLHSQWDFPERVAFNVTLRVYRCGGLAKDAIYLRGLARLLGLLEEGLDLDLLWVGKVAASHFPVIRELIDRGMLRRPVVQPAFLADPAAQRRIQRARKGMTLSELVNLQDEANEHRVLRQ